MKSESQPKRICQIDGCGRKHVARGLCGAHYHRLSRHGDPLGGGPARKKLPSRPANEVGAKVCGRCGTEKSLDDFYDDIRNLKDGKHGSCKKCHSSSSYESRKKTGKGIGKDANRTRNLKKHGMTKVEYDNMVAAQGGLCALCGEPPSRTSHGSFRLVVDHDHNTGEIRGLLCNTCNLGLGHFRDDPRKLALAIKYLDKE